MIRQKKILGLPLMQICLSPVKKFSSKLSSLKLVSKIYLYKIFFN